MILDKEKEQIVVISCVFNCLKEKCPKWVILGHGRCAEAWIAMLLAELLEKLKDK